MNLKPGHKIGSYDYIERVKRRMEDELPELSPFLSSGSLMDGVLNSGAPAPIDVRVAGYISDHPVHNGIRINR